MSDDIPTCSCAEFWGQHHPECPMRMIIDAHQSELTRLRSLIDAYQAREREARELMQEICRPWKGWDLSDGHSVRRAEAWLAATSVEGEGERASTQAVCAGERSAGH